MTVTSVAATLVVVLVLPVLVNLLSDEVTGWAFRWAEWLITHAVARLPSEYRERYMQEWRGELATCPGPLTNIAAATSILVRGRGLSRVLIVATGNVPTGDKRKRFAFWRLGEIEIRLAAEDLSEADLSKILTSLGVTAIVDRVGAHVIVKTARLLDQAVFEKVIHLVKTTPGARSIDAGPAVGWLWHDWYDRRVPHRRARA